MTKIELFDSNGGLIWKCGKVKDRDQYFETTVPEDETVVGFKVAIEEEWNDISGLGLVTAKNLSVHRPICSE